MKYIGMPFAVWQFFCASFEKNLPVFFGITKVDAKFIMAKAKEKYKEIIGNLPAFEKGDRFQMNIVGCAIRQLTLEDYNRCIAYVFQDNYLFDTTVMENIRMGKPSATDEEVIDAAKNSGCHDFIMSLEHGYATIVGGAGGHLSGGER